MNDPSETIVAVGTPAGRGGVGCVRISGPAAHAIARQLFRPARAESVAPGPVLRFGTFIGRDGLAVDHGYLVLFEAGASYTGETAAELWPHGSPVVLAALVDAAVGAGAFPAAPGEFTYRALLRGKLDLARAEAIRDLVAARTLYQARVAFAQAEGALSRRLAPVREGLADLIARAEATVEFVDEPGTGLPRGEIEDRIAAVRATLAELLAGFRTGRVAREGATLAITGLPNVGKSSLFNRLLERDRAIVAVSPGTTRDTLEEEIDLVGIPVRLVDTAGLRPATDAVEGEGVRRAREAREAADLVLLVLDASRGLEPAEEEALRSPRGASEAERVLVVLNKVDLAGLDAAPLPRAGALRVSALTGYGIPVLREAIRERVAGAGPLEPPVLTDARHALALERAIDAIDGAAVALSEGLSEEAVLEDLHEAMRRLGEITGEFGVEEIYERIFSTFCIGK